MSIDIEAIRQFNLAKEGVGEGFPFGEDVLVYKVYRKIFCLLRLSIPHTINLKCEPEKAIYLREKYDFVIPGYHMNKKHWNTWNIDDMNDINFLKHWIDQSYHLVLNSIAIKNRIN